MKFIEATKISLILHAIKEQQKHKQNIKQH